MGQPIQSIQCIEFVGQIIVRSVCHFGCVCCCCCYCSDLISRKCCCRSVCSLNFNVISFIYSFMHVINHMHNMVLLSWQKSFDVGLFILSVSVFFPVCTPFPIESVVNKEKNIRRIKTKVQRVSERERETAKNTISRSIKFRKFTRHKRTIFSIVAEIQNVIRAEYLISVKHSILQLHIAHIAHIHK